MLFVPPHSFGLWFSRQVYTPAKKVANLNNDGENDALLLDTGARTTPASLRVDGVSRDVTGLRSVDGRFTFGLLPDSNVAVQQGQKLIWESRAKSKREPPESKPYRLVLQSNGDLVAYDADHVPFWSSTTAKCGPRPYRLMMQDDGHAVLYDGDWRAHWATLLQSQQ